MRSHPCPWQRIAIDYVRRCNRIGHWPTRREVTAATNRATHGQHLATEAGQRQLHALVGTHLTEVQDEHGIPVLVAHRGSR